MRRLRQRNRRSRWRPPLPPRLLRPMQLPRLSRRPLPRPRRPLSHLLQHLVARLSRLVWRLLHLMRPQSLQSPRLLLPRQPQLCYPLPPSRRTLRLSRPPCLSRPLNLRRLLPLHLYRPRPRRPRPRPSRPPPRHPRPLRPLCPPPRPLSLARPRPRRPLLRLPRRRPVRRPPHLHAPPPLRPARTSNLSSSTCSCSASCGQGPTRTGQRDHLWRLLVRRWRQWPASSTWAPIRKRRSRPHWQRCKRRSTRATTCAAGRRGDGGEWGLEMGPGLGGEQHRRDTGPTAWASGGRTRIPEYCSCGLKTVQGYSVGM